MKKQIRVTMVDTGAAVGTVGWLAQHAEEIRILEKPSGKLAAYLYDAEGEIVSPLAVRDWWGNAQTAGEIVSVEIDRSGEFGPGARIPWTDAAWVVMCELGERAVELLREKLAEDDAAEMRDVVETL
jgi:hypothetical protein